MFNTGSPSSSNTVSNILGMRSYEVSNHLEEHVKRVKTETRTASSNCRRKHFTNIFVKPLDFKTIPHPSTSSVGLDYYTVEIAQATDYSPFGCELKGRNLKKTGVNKSFRFGFNGMEADDEIKGDGNSYDFGARMLDPRLGRFFAVDNFASNFSYYSPFNFAGNSPIWAMDVNGDSVWVYSERFSASLYMGRHMFMRVKTATSDVLIEMGGGSSESDNKGKVTITPFNKGTLDRDFVIHHTVYEPINKTDEDKFENDIIEYATIIVNNNTMNADKIVGNTILPDYNRYGPNSNTLVCSLVELAGGRVISQKGWGRNPYNDNGGFTCLLGAEWSNLMKMFDVLRPIVGKDEYYQNTFGMSKDDYNGKCDAVEKMNQPGAEKTSSSTPADNTKTIVNKVIVNTPKEKGKKKSS